MNWQGTGSDISTEGGGTCKTGLGAAVRVTCPSPKADPNPL